MTVVINRKNSNKLAEILANKLKNRKRKGKLIQHFGKLKRNLDGLQYQQSVRENED